MRFTLNNPDEAQDTLRLINKLLNIDPSVTLLQNEWERYYSNVDEPSARDNQAERLLELITSQQNANDTRPMEKVSQQKRFTSLDATHVSKDIIHLDVDNLGTLTYTKIVRGEFGELSVENIGWKDFVEKAIEYAMNKGVSFEILDKGLTVNVLSGGNFMNKDTHQSLKQTILYRVMDAQSAAKS